MKVMKYLMLMLTAFALCLATLMPSLAQESYGAERLEEEKPYDLFELMPAFLEETRLRMAWFEQTAGRFPHELLFKQALEAEKERASAMRRLFSSWGYAQEPSDPPHAPEYLQGLEQAVKGMRDMADRGMMMSRRLEAAAGAVNEVRAYAHMWGHEYRQQLDSCDLRAESLGYKWAWQYDEDEPDQELELP